MKRIDIVYGGQSYSVGGRELDDVLDEIMLGVTRGHHWLKVNDGEGMRRDAMLLITPGVQVAVIPIPGSADEPQDSSATSTT